MRAWAGLLVALGVWAQEPAPDSTIKGALLEWDGSPAVGELSLRAADNHVYCFLFDSFTDFERDQTRVSVAQLRAGDLLEIVAEAAGLPAVRYARRVRASVMPRAAGVSVAYRNRYLYSRLYGKVLSEELFPHGNLTFAGAVTSLNEHRLILRVRPNVLAGTRPQDKPILLTEDTRFFQDGAQVAPSLLRVNTRIFVRASENLDGDVEAYQVFWGSVLRPQ